MVLPNLEPHVEAGAKEGAAKLGHQFLGIAPVAAILDEDEDFRECSIEMAACTQMTIIRPRSGMAMCRNLCSHHGALAMRKKAAQPVLALW
jgi:hypothetical protein